MRCVNIDWLECFCYEDAIGFPHDAESFRRRGWIVRERDYGTRIYHEMFTLYTHDDMPFVEIRRNPKSTSAMGGNGILQQGACHVRLANRTCYYNDAADVMARFLDTNGFRFVRISRIDIALDFETFDSGDVPSKFVQRYMSGRYSKINQANIKSFGRDRWDGRTWNWLSWGSPTSAIGTKLYNKSLELKEAHDKPYIRQAWQAAGLVDDAVDLWKIDRNGRKYYPEIWRVEFSIKSGTRNWVVIEDKTASKRGLRSLRNTLDVYNTKDKILTMFFSLAQHYFHFKKVVEMPSKSVTQFALNEVRSINAERNLQRKDRCPDKTLFYPGKNRTFYSLENIATSNKPDLFLKRFRTSVIKFRDTHLTPETFKAANSLLQVIEEEIRLNDVARPWTTEKLTAIRLLVAQRIHDTKGLDTTTATHLIETLTECGDLFGEIETE